MTAALVRLTAASKRVRRNLQDYGWRITAAKIGAALVGPVYTHRVYRVYRIRLSAAALEDPRADPELVLRTLTPADAEAIGQVEALAEWLGGVVGSRLEQGDLCVAALAGPTLAGFNLITFGEAEVPGVAYRLSFRPDEAWSVHIGVDPRFRRRGVASALRRTAFRELRARGIRRFYGGAFPSNVASLELARRVGFREIADIEYRRLLAFRRWRLRRVQDRG